MIEVAQDGSGKVGVVIPHGVLFRGASEGKIRKQVIDENLLEAVIGLPANLFLEQVFRQPLPFSIRGRRRTMYYLSMPAESMKTERTRTSYVWKILAISFLFINSSLRGSSNPVSQKRNTLL